ncbi:PREDICTED: protein AHNAK2-like, partial [Acanthisitta chloris]|uniref:protein AHNAK2-like n=1 Tax=Acanthisitta chloris TaxID=57068 RepID=UPI0004F0CCA7
MPKFDMPKFRVSSPKVEGPGVEVSLPSAGADLPSTTLTAADVEVKADIPSAKTEGADLKLEKPSLKMPKADIKAPKVDITSVDMTLPKGSVHLQAPEAALSLEGEAKALEKEVTKSKDGKFKMPKFGMPSFGWSSSREAKGTVAAELDVSLKEPQVTLPSGAAEMDVTLPEAEIQEPTFEVTTESSAEFDTSTEKDGEKVRSKKSQFTMPKISFPKMKGQKVQVSLPVLETDVCSPKQEKEVVSVEKSEEGSSGEGAGVSIRVPKATVSTSEFSKPEVKAPKPEMDTGEVIPPTRAEGDLSLKSAAANATLSTSDTKMIPEGSIEVKSPETSVETTSREIAVGDVEIEVEGPEGKPKMPKFQMPKVDLKPSSTYECDSQKTGIKFPRGEASVELKSPDIATERTSVVDGKKVKLEGSDGKIKMPKFQKPKFGVSLTKGKGPEAEISSPKIEAELPQLKMTKEIADIAVGVPTSELASDKEDPGVVCKIKMLQALTVSIETPEVEISPQS